MTRSASVSRNTNETKIEVSINLDGQGSAKLNTGIGFLDHMLDQVARHGMFDLEVTAKGDLHIDAHHTVEDVGIVLGQAFSKAIGDKKGIKCNRRSKNDNQKSGRNSSKNSEHRAYHISHVFKDLFFMDNCE